MRTATSPGSFGRRSISASLRVSTFGQPILELFRQKPQPQKGRTVTSWWSWSPLPRGRDRAPRRRGGRSPRRLNQTGESMFRTIQPGRSSCYQTRTTQIGSRTPEKATKDPKSRRSTCPFRIPSSSFQTPSRPP